MLRFKNLSGSLSLALGKLATNTAATTGRISNLARSGRQQYHWLLIIANCSPGRGALGRSDLTVPKFKMPKTPAKAHVPSGSNQGSKAPLTIIINLTIAAPPIAKW